MDRIEDATKAKDMGFIKYVFKFDEPEKAVIMNIIQYTILAIIPLVLVLKGIKHFIPEADEDKGSLVMLTEVIGQLVIMFLSLYIVNRAVSFIPTYSGVGYGDINLINVVLAVLMISLTINSKLGEKVQILVDRAYEMYEGKPKKKQEQKQKNVSVSQPVVPNQISVPQHVNMQPQQTNNKSMTNEYSLPQMPKSPDFNNMYGGQQTPMVGASQPSMNVMEPMAANDALGGNFGAF